MCVKNDRLYPVELALLLGLALALLSAAWLTGRQNALSAQVVRLHVVGASNSAADQMAKLRVRDAVLAQAEPLLDGITDQAQARAVLAAHLEELARAGMGALDGQTTVRASLEPEAWFPTKQYHDFALPAGRYPALRLTLGEGAGRNWWCVVFPPLCMGAVTERAEERTECFTSGQVKLITGEEGGYVVKFKALELLGQLRERLSPPASTGR